MCINFSEVNKIVKIVNLINKDTIKGTACLIHGKQEDQGIIIGKGSIDTSIDYIEGAVQVTLYVSGKINFFIYHKEKTYRKDFNSINEFFEHIGNVDGVVSIDILQ